ncbi:MAG: HPr family phosphocarrier protein [Mollicutes bacterium PWAP]|nr:HPr family phosphocarrier protein [Mollicutes bacterium PWAP]
MKKLTIIDPVGLHARPAMLITQEAAKYKSDIYIINSEGAKGNLKSIMNVLALGIKNGDIVTIEINGEDSDDAITGIESVMKTNKLI